MAHWNTKKRKDDRRGYKIWTEESKQKVRIASTKHPLLQNEQWLRKQYLELKRTTVDIAKEIGCVNSTIFVALNRFHIPRRSRKEACKKGSEHHLWRGGSGFRSDTQYCEWRLMVFGRDEYTCKMCGIRGVYLNAHHILPCRDFPDLKYRVDNGITLCESCHRKTYNSEMDYIDTFKSLVKKNPNSVEPRTGNTELSTVEKNWGMCRDYGDSPKGMI